MQYKHILMILTVGGAYQKINIHDINRVIHLIIAVLVVWLACGCLQVRRLLASSIECMIGAFKLSIRQEQEDFRWFCGVAVLSCGPQRYMRTNASKGLL